MSVCKVSERDDDVKQFFHKRGSCAKEPDLVILSRVFLGLKSRCFSVFRKTGCTSAFIKQAFDCSLFSRCFLLWYCNHIVVAESEVTMA